MTRRTNPQPCMATASQHSLIAQEEADRAHRAEVRLDQTIRELRKVQVTCEETLVDPGGLVGPGDEPCGW